jgi:hypothetical protein
MHTWELLVNYTRPVHRQVLLVVLPSLAKTVANLHLYKVNKQIYSKKGAAQQYKRCIIIGRFKENLFVY